MLPLSLPGRSRFRAALASGPLSLPGRSRFRAALVSLSFLSTLVLVLSSSCRAQGQQGGTHGTYVWSDGTGYSPTYSGGQCVIDAGDGKGPGKPILYGPLKGITAWGGGGTPGAPTPPPGQTSSEKCSGAITATFTWKPNPSNPNEPPPASAVVQQDCQILTYLSPGATVTFDSGMGHAGSGYHDTLYTVQPNPGKSFSIKPPCSPSLTVTVPYPSTNSAGTVQYSAVAFPVTVDTTGTTPVGGSQALTGQQITASLNFNGAPVNQVSSYTWSFTGGTAPNPIKNWDPNGLAADGVTLQQLFPLTSTDLTGTDTTGNGIPVKSLSFYDQVADKVTVICTVNFTFPDGTAGTVAPQSQPITFLKPTASWTLQTVPAYMGTIQPSQMPGFFTDYKTAMVANAWWDPVTITVPPGFPGGLGGFAQIATFSRTYKGTAVGTGTAVTYVNMIQDSKGNWYHPGAGLDGGYNYPLGYPDNNGKDGTLQLSSYTWNTSVPGHSGDTPKISLTQSQQNLIKSRVQVSDSFNTYLMFQPPGGIWVPLQTITWSWGATADLPLNGTQWNVTNPNFYSSPSAQSATSPPSWSLVIPYGIHMQIQQ